MVYRDPSKELFSEEEAAALLGMSKRMLAKRRYEGKIGHCKDGHFIGYSQRHIDSYCEKFDKDRPLNHKPSLTSQSKKAREPWKERKLRQRKVNAEQRDKDKKSAERAFKRHGSAGARFMALITGFTKSPATAAGEAFQTEESYASGKAPRER